MLVSAPAAARSARVELNLLLTQARPRMTQHLPSKMIQQDELSTAINHPSTRLQISC